MRVETDYTESYNYFIYTLEELKEKVDKEYECMSKEEKYMRIKHVEPTFLEYVLSWAGNEALKENERIKINEMTNEYEITKIY